MSIKITHLASACLRYDTHVFIAMCSSLAINKKYEASLILVYDKCDEVKR